MADELTRQLFERAVGAQKATSIGPPKVGTRIQPYQSEDLLTKIARLVLGADPRPSSVAAQDPYGYEAWSKDRGPMPGFMMGSTEKVTGPLSKLYSRVQRAVEAAPDKMHPSKALAWLKNRASKEELDYRKVPAMLEAKGNQPVTKAELASHLEANPVKLKETIRGGVKRPKFNSVNELIEDVKDPNHYRASKYGQYSTPGGENYKETLIQLDRSKPVDPDAPPFPEFKEWAYKKYALDVDHVGLDDYEHMFNSYLEETSPNLQGVDDGVRDYTSSHWDEPNILVHTRSNERRLPGDTHPTGAFKYSVTKKDTGEVSKPMQIKSPEEADLIRKHWQEIMTDAPDAPYDLHLDPEMSGPKGTFLEEVQSDWHQQGKEKGYVTPEIKAAKDAKLKEIRDRIDNIYRERERVAGEQYATERLFNERHPGKGFLVNFEEMHPGHWMEKDPDFIEWKRLNDDYAKLTNEKNLLDEEVQAIGLTHREAVPDAPFKESWPDLALKRHLMEVAESPDQEWLGWTTGKAQADRYNLSKYVDRVAYDPQTQTLTAWGKEGLGAEGEVLSRKVAPEDLPAYLGREAASKILEVPPERLSAGGQRVNPGYGIRRDNPEHFLEGQSLQMGGEGMKYFYDQLLPARMNKILRPFGGQAELGTIDALPTGALRQNNPALESIQGWIAKLSPEMKERIKKEGLPLMMILLMQHLAKGKKEEQ
jgi:hypothetical protein